jgi:hypothetical protein
VKPAKFKNQKILNTCGSGTVIYLYGKLKVPESFRSSQRPISLESQRNQLSREVKVYLLHYYYTFILLIYNF